jgi:hypothetical protein
MKYVKLFFLSVLLSCSIPAFADSTSMLAESQAVEKTEGFVSAVSNICSISADASSVKNFSIEQVTSGNYICNKDFVIRMWFGLVGMTGLESVVANLGFTDHIEGNEVILNLFSFMRNVYLAMFAVVCFFMLALHLLGFTREEISTDHMHRPINMVLNLMIFFFALPITGFMFIWTCAMTNQGGLEQMKQTAMKYKETGMLSDTSKLAIDTDLGNKIKIVTSGVQTNRALFQKGLVDIGMAPPSSWGFSGSLLTKNEVIPEMLKQTDYQIKPNTSYKLNMDLHPEALKTINFNEMVNKYEVKKIADYNEKQKSVYGYPSTIATFLVNTQASNFERQSSESMNDGNIETQMNDINMALAKQSSGDAKAGLPGRFISDVKSLEADLITKITNEGSAYKSSDFYEMAGLQESIGSDVKGVVHQYINIDDLDLKHASSIPQVYSMAYSKALTTLFGDDKTGQGLQDQFDFIKTEIVDAKLNEMCTLNWDENLRERQLAARFNGMPSNAVYKDLIRSGQYDDLQASMSMSCLKLDKENNIIGVYGSENIADVKKFQIQQLAAYKALQTISQNYMLGVKKSLAEEKSGTDNLWYNLVIISQQGFVGSMILAEGEINRFRNNENLKSQMLNNGMTSTYHQVQTGEETNYVNYDVMFGKSDISRRAALEDSYNNIFPPIDYTNLQLSGVINVSPANLDDDSFWSNLDLTAFFFKIIGMDPVSVKWMLQIPESMTIPKGAAYCIDKPTECETLPKVDLLTGVYGMGSEFKDWGMTVIIIKGVTSTAVLAMDSLPKVVDAVTNASVGSNNSFGAGVKKGLNFIVSLSSKLIKIALYTLDSLLSVFLPLAYIMFGIGVFVCYVIPALKIFSVVSMVLAVFYSLMTFLLITLLVNACKSVYLEKEAANAAMFDNAKTLIGLCAYVPIYMFFVMLSNHLNATIDISGPGRQLVANGDGSVVQTLLGLIQLFALAIYIVLSNINAIVYNAEKTMSATFGFGTINQRDELSKQAITAYQNQQILSDLQSGQNRAGNLFEQVKQKMKAKKMAKSSKPRPSQNSNFE